MNLKEGLALQAAAKKKGKDKYGAKRTVLDGITFASGSEAKRYGALLIEQRAGLIRNLALQVKYQMMVNGHLIGTYTSDFEYESLTNLKNEFGAWIWMKVVEDHKSGGTKRQRDWPRTKKLMLACHGIAIHESGV